MEVMAARAPWLPYNPFFIHPGQCYWVRSSGELDHLSRGLIFYRLCMVFCEFDVLKCREIFAWHVGNMEFDHSISYEPVCRSCTSK